jgi:hypothetical protein
MIHGVGAETGSQVLLPAGVAGVTGAQGIVILVAFIVGLLASNTLAAVTSATGHRGAAAAHARRDRGRGRRWLEPRHRIVLHRRARDRPADLQQLLFGGRE